MVELYDGQIVQNRPIAIRYANGHTLQYQPFLRPERIAAAMSTDFASITPGFFHVTPISRLRSIIKQGLLPGAALNNIGRMDIHATMFGPTDPRGEQTRTRITETLQYEAQCAVVFIEAANVIATARVNLGDGVCLWSDPIPIEKITCITAVSRAYGEHTDNVARGLRFDILYDSQFGTIKGQRRPHQDDTKITEHQRPSTLTRGRLRERGYDIDVMSARQVAKIPPTSE